MDEKDTVDLWMPEDELDFNIPPQPPSRYSFLRFLDADEDDIESDQHPKPATLKSPHTPLNHTGNPSLAIDAPSSPVEPPYFRVSSPIFQADLNNSAWTSSERDHIPPEEHVLFLTAKSVNEAQQRLTPSPAQESCASDAESLDKSRPLASNCLTPSASTAANTGNSTSETSQQRYSDLLSLIGSASSKHKYETALNFDSIPYRTAQYGPLWDYAIRDQESFGQNHFSQPAVIDSSLADIPCSELDIDVVMSLLDELWMMHNLCKKPRTGLRRHIERALAEGVLRDFGFIYAFVRLLKGTNTGEEYVMDETYISMLLKSWGEGHCFSDPERNNAVDLKRGCITAPHIGPRRLWDLLANRVVPTRFVQYGSIIPISHPWLVAEARMWVQTPINGCEWPVPIPQDVTLERVRIEILNKMPSAEYAWLDVLCLRQDPPPTWFADPLAYRAGLSDVQDLEVRYALAKEQLQKEIATSWPRRVRFDLEHYVNDLKIGPRMAEFAWKLITEHIIDVPTIGNIYRSFPNVAVYVAGLGRPVELIHPDPLHERNWLNRAWTLQEVTNDLEGCGLGARNLPLQVQQRAEEVNCDVATAERTILKLSIELDMKSNLFVLLEEMRSRSATNERDKVAGLAYLLRDPESEIGGPLPLYFQGETADEAWITYASKHMDSRWKADLFFLFPAAAEGRNTHSWLPTWTQLMGPVVLTDIDRRYHDLHLNFTSRDGELQYNGPMITDAHFSWHVNKWQVGRLRCRRASISLFHHNSHRNYRDPTVLDFNAFEMVAYHSYPFWSASGGKLGDLVGSHCRKYWAVGKLEYSQDRGRLEFLKTSVLMVAPSSLSCVRQLTPTDGKGGFKIGEITIL